MVEIVLIGKETMVAAAMKVNVTLATVRKSVRRYISEGKSGLEDRSSRPHSTSRAMPRKFKRS